MGNEVFQHKNRKTFPEMKKISNFFIKILEENRYEFIFLPKWIQYMRFKIIL